MSILPTCSGASARRQSAKVGCLAQSLFELARLERGQIRPPPEAFSLAYLLRRSSRSSNSPHRHGVSACAQIASRLPDVHADLGMIERTMTNQLVNAIRETQVRDDRSRPRGL